MKFFAGALSLVPFAVLISLSCSAENEQKTRDGTVLKKRIKKPEGTGNLLKPGSWRAWRNGFQKKGVLFICDNGTDTTIQRGASQTVVLNQTEPQPIAASAWSKAENVTGSKNSDYALYLDLLYTDGTSLWGQVDAFAVGTHEWEKAEVVIVPEKPVKSLAFHMLLRRHGGKAYFRDPELAVIAPPRGAVMFDGVPVTEVRSAEEGFQIRDVASGGDFLRMEKNVSGITLRYSKRSSEGTDFFDAAVSDTTGNDRAVTILYAVPVPAETCRWFHDPRTQKEVETRRAYTNTAGFSAGANGRLSRYPFAAVASGGKGYAIGIDMSRPAFFRAGYNSGTEELFLAYDIGLTPEKPNAHLRFCRFSFDPEWGFRSALSRYYELFPKDFLCRTPEQGIWMPFAKISAVEKWEDFGFKFKEGNNETAWDDRHDIITFRYTEPMTWWMRMSDELPRSYEAAVLEAKRRAEKGDRSAKAFFACTFHDENGRFPVRLLNTPWCNGAVWSINSMPGVAGEATDFQNKWNPELKRKLYKSEAKAVLDGEYIDSSEGYVTDQLNFRRSHFKTARTPLTFSRKSRTPAIFRGLIAFEYIRAIADDVHGMNRLMMANATPIRLCWLAPLLDVMGSETNWNRGGNWRPMSDADLLYRRALCRGKPYCFLMNTEFEKFPHTLVEKYMKRCLAYGMFPGFFSHNASQGHYFTRPELYDRDRSLFKKYVPLCKLIAEARWEPVTNARSSNSSITVERFGARHLTVYNQGAGRQKTDIVLKNKKSGTSRELVTDTTVEWKQGTAGVTLEGEDVLVLEVPFLK